MFITEYRLVKSVIYIFQKLSRWATVMTMVITSDATNSELSVADTTDPLTAASARVTRGPSGETREEAAQAGVEESEGAVTMTAAAVVEVTVVKDTRLLRVDVTEPEICLLRINA